MAGTISTPIFKQDGQYLSFVAGTGGVTLGQVVSLDVTGSPSTVIVAASGSFKPIGVAVAGNRVSRTATDNVVASGDRVTVLTRGVANVTAYGSVLVGEKVIVGTTSGTVATAGSSGDVNPALLVGRALETASSAAAVAVLLSI